MQRKAFWGCLALLWSMTWIPLRAEKLTFTAKAPAKVIMGQEFRLTYTINTTDVKDFRIPEINNDFDILAGPSSSTSTQISNINGQRSTIREYSYTYILMPKKEGVFTIPPANITSKKEKLTSNSLNITVLPADKTTTQRGNSNAEAEQETSSSAISGEQVFIRVIPSKTEVYEQEGITLTYKLYTRVDIAGVENAKFPEFKGFFSQEIEQDPNQQWDMENYKDMNYRTVILKQTVLYPQQDGLLEIESGSFDLIVRVRNTNQRMRSFFDDFFDTYQDVRKTLKSPALKINVKPYPFGKPADFNPFTGSLKISSSISTTELKADEPVTLTLNLSGNGNMKMLKTPDIQFPADFDVYDPKVTNHFKTSTKGVSGTKTIEYLVIPRYGGQYTIPSVSVGYFDLASKSYKTIQSDPYEIHVAKSESTQGSVVSGNYTQKEELRMLGQDIRYLKKNQPRLKSKESLLPEQPWFVWAYVLPMLVFVIVLMLYRKQVKANADLVMVRNRKANKVAVRRLKNAAMYLKAQDKAHFYDEVLKALWGYTSDKLNLPLSQLSKDNIDAQLHLCQVDEETRNEFVQILQTCEFERFAPGEGVQAMDDLYGKTMKVIGKMENTIKAHVKK